MLMAHGCPERELQIDRRRCRENNRSEGDRSSRPYRNPIESTPGLGRHRGNEYQQSQKGLREQGMEYSDLVLQHRYAKATENALQNDRAQGDKTEAPHRGT